ncbi:MAG: histidine kinase [Saprospiraceae bacterium]
MMVCSFNSWSQELNDINFELIDEEDGLSTHLITQFVQDSAGFLWIGTYDGLNRYDGKSFKIFRHEEGNSNSLQDDVGQTLFVDYEGTLWLGYTRNRLSRFIPECQCFENFDLDSLMNPEEAKGYIRVFLRDRDGGLWFSSRELGLNVYYPRTGFYKRYNLPDIDKRYSRELQSSYNTVTYAYEDSNGLMWLCTANGLYSFDRKSETFSFKRYGIIDPTQGRSDYFNYLLPNGNIGFWLTAWGGGVSYFDRKSETFQTYKYDLKDLNSSFGNINFNLEWKSPDELWVSSTDRGLGIFTISKKEFQFVTSGGEKFKGVSLVNTTRDGVLFMLTYDGLFKYNPNSNIFHFKSLPIASSQNTNDFYISRIIEDPKYHATYFATVYGNGLNVMDPRKKELQVFDIDIDPSSGNQFKVITDLVLDTMGSLWISSRDYLYEFDRTKRRMIKISDPFEKNEYNGNPHFNSIKMDKDRDMWVVTGMGGLHRFSRETRKLAPSVNNVTSNSSVFPGIGVIIWDKYDRMWVFGGGKIGIYDKKSNSYSWPLPTEIQALTKEDVRGIAADGAGNIWMGVNKKGLLKIDIQDPNKAVGKLITEADGLPFSRLADMNTDPEGNIWVSTFKGAVYMNYKTLQYRIFNHGAGMDKNTVNMDFMKAGGSSFYITTPGKYCRVNFEAANRVAPLPEVYIDKFSIFNKDQSERYQDGQTVIVHPDEDFFSFDFGCFDFTNQSLNQFAYKLEGWDKDWVYCGARRYANYTNLNGGKYVFKVKVANNEGIWGEPIAVPVFIETHFYKKTWFVVLAAFFFSGLIYSLYLYRVRQIERTEKLKTEFNKQLAESRMQALRAQMNPHFIFNCLNSINRYIIKSDIKTSSLYLTKFAKLIRLILDNSASKSVVLSNELEALKLYIEMELLRFDHKFTYAIEVAPEIDPENVEIPPMIIQPYVENAIWHGLLHKESGGHLIIKVGGSEEALTCEIIDNGIGREKAREYKSPNAPTRKSMGMRLTEERLQITGEGNTMAGSQEIIDLYDEQGLASGTKVIITIPI